MNKLNGYAKFEKLIDDYAPSFIGPLAEEKLKDENFFSTQEGMEFIIFNGFNEILSSAIQKYTTTQCKSAPLCNTYLAEISNKPASRFCFNL
ncbi:hypothetical protein [Sulfurimonas sp.]|uniref:hypothetical protein n=1 Tax=Sulfurimonas sp. TaxID=2022749 RepID=UPI00260BF182|nr:hypothetical protein [Sulfurimonas sp.]